MADSNPPIRTAQSAVRLPRVTIQFCTQCKWNLRAAYVNHPPSLPPPPLPSPLHLLTHSHQFAQELLQTFSTSLGEVSLQPSTGGVFKVDLYHSSSGPASASPSSPPTPSSGSPAIQHTPLWDRKADGGFPETKELKRRVRDAIEPGRNLGHVDRDYPASGKQEPHQTAAKEGKDDDNSGAGKEDEQGKGKEEEEAAPPRPRDIAARAGAAAPTTQPPPQRERGSDDRDRTVGGTKPMILKPPRPRHEEDEGHGQEGDKEETTGKGGAEGGTPVAKDEQMKLYDGEGPGGKTECEDCA